MRSGSISGKPENVSNQGGFQGQPKGEEGTAGVNSNALLSASDSKAEKATELAMSDGNTSDLKGRALAHSIGFGVNIKECLCDKIAQTTDVVTVRA